MQRTLLTLTLVTPLVLFGGAYPWSTAPLLALATLTAIATGRWFWFPRDQRLIDGAIAAVCLALVLQIVPLPLALRDWLSAQAGAVTGRLLLGSDSRSLVPLSIDPSATRHAAATMAFAVLTFWSARGIFARGGVRAICRVIVVIGVVLAVSGVAQRVISPTHIFGVWAPSAIGSRPFGPFVNPHYFAAWLLMAVPVSIGYLIAHARTRIKPGSRTARERAPDLAQSRVVPLTVAIGMMMVVLASTRSRSALAGLSIALLAGWLLVRSRVASSVRSATAAVGVASAAMVALLLIADIDALAARLEPTYTSARLEPFVIWRESLRVIGDFPLTGVGGGAYGTAMLFYQQPQSETSVARAWIHFNQAQSHYVQALAEGGLLLLTPVSIGLVALVRAGGRALRGDAGEIFWIRAGAAAALVGIAAQSAWETALTMPANAALAAVAAAMLVYRRQPRHA